MNLQLLDPFEQDFPEVIEDTLEDGSAVTVKFNRRGTLLAAGCTDGTIVVWDFDTRGVSRTLIGHVKSVTSLSSLFVAAFHQEKPLLIDFSDGIKRTHILAEQDVKATDQTPTPAGQHSWTLVVTFDRHGKRIYTGSNRGHISIIDTESRTLLHEIRPTTSAIKAIHFSRRGRDFVVNANDRIIRVFATRDEAPPEQLHKFQDLVNRNQWNQCCLSSDSDYVIGGSGQQAEHNIYIWDKTGGQLVKILEGPKEPLEDLAWHPIRPIVASVTSYGTIYIWATNYQENWSAFAPDFKELEENIDYEEREDEFDIVPEEEASKRKHDDEDVVVDVTTAEKVNPFNDSDSDNGEEEMFYLPLLPSDQQDEELLHAKRHRRKDDRRRRQGRSSNTKHHHHYHHSSNHHDYSHDYDRHHHQNRHLDHHPNSGYGDLQTEGRSTFPAPESQQRELFQDTFNLGTGGDEGTPALSSPSSSPPPGLRRASGVHQSSSLQRDVKEDADKNTVDDRRKETIRDNERDRVGDGDRDRDRDRDRYQDRDQERDRNRDRDHERERDRDRDRERERERDRDRERERKHKHKQHRSNHIGGDDRGGYSDIDHGVDKKLSRNGGSSSHDQEDSSADRDSPSSSGRRRLDETSPVSRSIKRQR
ncbi:hypothetical protein BGW38_006423 [Lunasporangiospora selenospora]|uniref:WD40 repeat-like protein n=1 Tax=Lunasporangiospora selenospora TaxID=979761 RepID=A0A9P6FZT1_9FUNG|nr:hypothetical protein BGW38_006423 [Lunasporangiospora selenospora]